MMTRRIGNVRFAPVERTPSGWALVEERASVFGYDDEVDTAFLGALPSPHFVSREQIQFMGAVRESFLIKFPHVGANYVPLDETGSLLGIEYRPPFLDGLFQADCIVIFGMPPSQSERLLQLFAEKSMSMDVRIAADASALKEIRREIHGWFAVLVTARDALTVRKCIGFSQRNGVFAATDGDVKNTAMAIFCGVSDFIMAPWEVAVSMSLDAAMAKPDTPDLNSAWMLTEWDIHRRHFVDLPHESDLVRIAKNNWLESIQMRLLDGSYQPSEAEIFSVPKRGTATRPGTRLKTSDAIVYSALAQSLASPIRKHLAANPPWDLAYQILPRATGGRLFYNAYRCWKEYRAVSEQMIADTVTHVVFADISGFYENIDIVRLGSRLRDIGTPKGQIDRLLECLTRWAGPRGRGIPQGHSASDLLAKLYLDIVDRHLWAHGYRHVRYVDDFRIFCSDSRHARRAALHLEEVVREHGLNLESSKTSIATAKEAMDQIRGSGGAIAILNSSVREAVANTSPWVLPYEPRVSDFSVLAAAPGMASRTVLESAFSGFSSSGRFDSSLFHFMLNRLASVRSSVAVDFALEQLRVRPEETDGVLSYFSAFADDSKLVAKLVNFLASPDAIFDYQRFRILRWIFLHPSIGRTEDLISIVKGVRENPASPIWLRAYATALIGRFGNSVELDALADEYMSEPDDVYRSVILCALVRLPSSRLDELCRWAPEESPMTRAAVQFVQRRAAVLPPRARRDVA